MAWSGSTWRLPLAECVALGLMDVLLVEGDGRRASRLSRLLSEDAALALWSACRASERGEALRGVKDLAAWLAPRMLVELQWGEEGEEASEAEERAERVAYWAELTERGAAAACEAARRAARRLGAEAADRARLLGLLHAAPDWLAACRCAVSSSGDSSPAPPALRALLEPLGDPASSGDPVAKLVRSVLDDVRRNAVEAAGEGGASRCGARAAEVKARWLRRSAFDASSSGPSMLRRLVARLSRLDRLELDFDAALEDEKLAALKELAYGASHEINNPLANISTRAQTLLRTESDPERRRKLATINAQAFRAHEMIADLMLFAKPPEIQPAPLRLSGVIDQVTEELAEDSRRQGTEIVNRSPDADLTVQADPVQLPLALKAMCVNSLEALGSGGRIEIRAAAAAGPPPDQSRRWVEITVSDTGPGISPSARRHLFDPYFSGREAGRGLGLGLSKCWRIVTEHGGRIEAHSGAKQGATFTIRLPG